MIKRILIGLVAASGLVGAVALAPANAAPAPRVTTLAMVTPANSNTDSYCSGKWQAATWGRGCDDDCLVASDDTATDGHYVEIREYYSGAWHYVSGTKSDGASSALETLHNCSDAVQLYRSDGAYKTLQDTA